MQLKYFVVDADERLWQVSRYTVEDLWKNHATSDEFDFNLDEELRLITVLCNERLLPIVTFFVHLELEQGRITDESRVEAFEAMGGRDDVTSAKRQFFGWPDDWPHQLAVALDVPISHFRKVGVGGPLLMSDLWGIPLQKVLDYFAEVNGDLDA